MNKWIVAVAMSVVAGTSCAGNLCSINPFSRAEAEQGKVAFESHCGLCHQYNMAGRQPGNYQNESPDINLLSASDVKFLDGAGGNVPPLIGAKFFKKHDHDTLTDFANSVAGAAGSFPPVGFQPPKSFFLISAYIIYRNCGKM